MSVLRDKPEIRKKSFIELSPQAENPPCLWTLFGLALSIPLLYMFTDVLNGKGTAFELSVCFGLLIVMVILGLWSWWQDSQARAAEENKWMQGCKVAEVKVVSRHGGTWDDGNRFHTAFWLEIEMASDQVAAAPKATIVIAQVSQNVYDRFKNRSTARIYYLPEAPLKFLFEEEFQFSHA